MSKCCDDFVVDVVLEGPQGRQGDPGPRGEKGEKGDAGDLTPVAEAARAQAVAAATTATEQAGLATAARNGIAIPLIQMATAFANSSARQIRLMTGA